MKLNIFKVSVVKTMVGLVFLTLNQPTLADWKDLLKIFKSNETESASSETVSALTNDEIIAGLKEALIKGTSAAVSLLGQHDGFLSNPDVRIPMPDSLRSVEKGLRRVGQDRVADRFIETMNRAAEQAVPVAADVFKDSVKAMTINDARKILSGPDNAATQYFRETGGDTLKDRFLPIVKDATENVELTAKYKNLVGKLGPVSGLVDTSTLDLDSYITDKALDGLFLIVAREEKKIRDNPLERTTGLLKKVFAGLN